MIYHPFRHLGLKLISVAIAALLWLTVAGETVVERSLRVPLELQNVPVGLEVVESPPATADVRIRGASSVLSRLAPGDVMAVLDVSLARPGSRLFHLTTSQVRAPFGVEVAQISPGTVSLRFEASGTKLVPVTPLVEGQPAEGYAIREIRAEPRTVEIVGPESALALAKQAVTEPISVAGATRTITEAATIGVADPSVRLRVPHSALVTIEIAAIPIERAFERVVVQQRNLGGGYSARLVPATVTLLVRGPKERVATLDAASLGVHVDLKNLGSGRHSVPVQVAAAADIEVVRVQPAAVTAFIR